MAGISPAEVDVAEIYDCFTFAVPLQLEDYGFCGPGEGGAFVESRTLPVNTHGGFLSEGYVHGLEPRMPKRCRQLRGDADRARCRSPRSRSATGAPGYVGGATSALLLRRAA